MSTLAAVQKLICVDREHWLRVRRRFICSTDASALWGCNPYSSAYAVAYAKKVGDDQKKPSIIMRHGHACEPFVAELFTEETGIELRDPGDFTLSHRDDIPHMAATVDRMTATRDAVVELKTASFRAAKEWRDRIPRQYQTQLTHAMICCDVELAYIAVLIDASTFRHHTMRLNERFAAAHVAKCETFWRDYVERDDYPPPDYSDATKQAIALRFPEDNGESLALPKALAECGEQWDTQQQFEAAATQSKQLIANRVKDAMGDATECVLPDGSGWTWAANAKGTRIFRRKGTSSD